MGGKPRKGVQSGSHGDLLKSIDGVAILLQRPTSQLISKNEETEEQRDESDIEDAYRQYIQGDKPGVKWYVSTTMDASISRQQPSSAAAPRAVARKSALTSCFHLSTTSRPHSAARKRNRCPPLSPTRSSTRRRRLLKYLVISDSDSDLDRSDEFTNALEQREEFRAKVRRRITKTSPPATFLPRMDNTHGSHLRPQTQDANGLEPRVAVPVSLLDETRRSSRLRSETRDSSVIDPDFLNFPTENDVAKALRANLESFHKDHYAVVCESLASVRESLETTKHLELDAFRLDDDPFADITPDDGIEDGVEEYSVVVPESGEMVDEHSFGTVSYLSKVPEQPRYTHYTNIKSTLLGTNELELRYLAELSEAAQEQQLNTDWKKEYRDRNPSTRIHQVPERIKLKQLKPYLLRFFEELGITIEDVEFYLLDDVGPLPKGMPEFLRKSWENRNLHFAIPFEEEQGLIDIGSRRLMLPDTTNRRLALAGLCCKKIKDICGVRLYPAISEWIDQGRKQPKPAQKVRSSRQLHEKTQCAICFVHDCPHHGEFVESSAGLSSADDCSALEPDMLLDKEVNYRKRVVNGRPLKRKIPTTTAFFHVDGNIFGLTDEQEMMPSADRNLVETSSGFADHALCSKKCFWKVSNRQATAVCPWEATEIELLKQMLPFYASDKRGPCMMAMAITRDCAEVFHQSLMLAQSGTIDTEAPVQGPPRKIKKRGLGNAGHFKIKKRGPGNVGQSGMVNARKPFYPCSHEGTCESANCSCFRKKIHCEKTCGCAQACTRRFPGCKCKKTRGTCAAPDRCICCSFNRECDPDLCGRCGAIELLDPHNTVAAGTATDMCQNVQIQKGEPARILLGRASIAGYGVFAGEKIKRGELVGEYMGEQLSKFESRRRGEFYHVGKNYLFSHYQDYDLDGFYLSNKLRFANHASKRKYQNCHVGYRLCNTALRIGIFAKRDIEIGEEILYDYGYKTAEHLEGFKERDGTNSKDLLPLLAKNEPQKASKRARATTGYNGTPGVPLAKPDNVVAGSSNGKLSKPRSRTHTPPRSPSPDAFEDGELILGAGQTPNDEEESVEGNEAEFWELSSISEDRGDRDYRGTEDGEGTKEETEDAPDMDDE